MNTVLYKDDLARISRERDEARDELARIRFALGDAERAAPQYAIRLLIRERDEARRVLLDVLDGFAAALTWSAKHRAEKRSRDGAVQRERDRAQAIIHHVLGGGVVSWGMFIGADGRPEPQP